MCRFVFEEKTRMQRIECWRAGAGGGTERVWGYDEAGCFVEDAALAADDARLYVARFSNISSGAEVRAFQLKSGEEVWRTRVVGLGPIGHSEYLNEVQIGVLGAGRLQVLGWESAGRYIEILDVASGLTLETLRISPEGRTSVVPPSPPSQRQDPPRPGEANAFAWRWQGPEPSQRRSSDLSIAVRGGTCSFSVETESKRTHLACSDAKKKRVWGIDLADQFAPGAALAADDKRLYLAEYSAIATGASVAAFELETGRAVWKTQLFGLGPISHSKYRNEVVIQAEGERVVVSGWESEGKYVEVLDASDGRIRGSRPEER